MSKHEKNLDAFFRGAASAFALFPTECRHSRRDEIAADADADVVLERAWSDVNNGLDWAFEQYDATKKAQTPAKPNECFHECTDS